MGHLAALWILLVAIAGFFCVPSAFEYGRPQHFELHSGQTRSFTFYLLSGKYVHLTAEQKGIDVAITVVDPDHRTICQSDSWTSNYGLEPIDFITDATGYYVVSVSAVKDKASPGEVLLWAAPLRNVTRRDRGRITGLSRSVRLNYEAQKLLAAGVTTHEVLGKFRQALAALPEDYPLWRASILTNISEAEYELGEIQASLTSGRRALGYWREVHEPDGEAEALYAIGLDLYQTGLPTQSLPIVKASLNKWHDARNSKGEAAALCLLGRIHQSTGAYDSALSDYIAAIPKLDASADPSWEGTLRHNFGMLYFALGDAQGALAEYNKALEFAAKANEPQEKPHLLHHIGEVYSSTGRFAEATVVLDQSFQLETHKLGKAATLLQISTLKEARGDLFGALESAKLALKLRDDEHYLLGRPQALLKLGRLYRELGRNHEARETLNASRVSSSEMGDKAGVAAALNALALTDRDEGLLLAAEQESEAAVTIAEQLRTDITSEEYRALYFSGVHDYFETQIDIYTRLYEKTHRLRYDKLALSVSERSRARTMLDAITGISTTLTSGASAQLRTKWKETSDALAYYSERRYRIMAEGVTDRDSGSMQREITDLTEDLRSIETRMRKMSRTAGLATESKPYRVERLQEALDPDTTILDYFVGEKTTYSWVLTRRSFKSFQFPSRSALSALVESYYEGVGSRVKNNTEEFSSQTELRVQHIDAHLMQIAHELSLTLLEPVMKFLNNKRLAIVPDGPLQYVPFSALPVTSKEKLINDAGVTQCRRTSPLISTHEIIELPSASVWLAARKHRRPQASSAMEIALFGDPVFSTEDTRYPPSRQLTNVCTEHRLSQSPNGTVFPRLLYSSKELDLISALVKPNQAYVARGFQASLNELERQQLQSYRFLHFATHGVIFPHQVQASGLILSTIDECGQPRDGYLGLPRIYNLHLHAECVVLSACATTRGAAVDGEGVMSVSRAFMFAGARSVISSLWAINDSSTADFMDRFYRAIKHNGTTPASALRKAQIEMLNDDKWGSAYYWAAFVIQGDWL